MLTSFPVPPPSCAQVKLCAYQPFELPVPTTAADGAAPGLLGMMTALSRDGRWLAVAGTLEAGSTMAQVQGGGVGPEIRAVALVDRVAVEWIWLLWCVYLLLQLTK